MEDLTPDTAPVIVLDPEVVNPAEIVVGLASKITACTDEEEYSMIADVRRSLKTRKDAIFEAVEPMRKAADETKKAILDFRNKACARLEEEDVRLGLLASVFLIAEKKRASEEEARVQAIREKEEKARRDREAKKLVKAGKPEDAERLLERPLVVAPAVVFLGGRGVSGAPSRKNWGWKVTDESLIPREWFDLSEKRLGSFVRQNGESAMRIVPGIEVFEILTQTIRR